MTTRYFPLSIGTTGGDVACCPGAGPFGCSIMGVALGEAGDKTMPDGDVSVGADEGVLPVTFGAVVEC